MSGDVDLFGDLVVPPEDRKVGGDPKESYQRRLTARQRSLAAAGVNPLAGTSGPAGKTCGDCVARVLVLWHDRTYPKCERGRWSHSAATDVRAWWPACHEFAPKGDR